MQEKQGRKFQFSFKNFGANNQRQRRCVHDENGNIDPVKQNEPVVPRGSGGKKRKSSGGDDSDSSVKKIKLDPADVPGLFLGDDPTLNGIPRSLFSTPIAQMTTTEELDTVTPNSSLAIVEQRELGVPGHECNGGTIQNEEQVESLYVDSDLLAPETYDLNCVPKSQGPQTAQQGMQVLHKLTNGTDQQNTVIEAIDETTPRDIVMKDFISSAETTSTHTYPVSISSPDRLSNGTSIGPFIDINGDPKQSDVPHPTSDAETGSEPVATTTLTELLAKDVENGIKSGEQYQHQHHEPPPPTTPNTEKQRRHSSRQSRPIDRFSPVKPTAASPTPGSTVRRKDRSAGLLNGKSASPDASATGIPKAKQSSPVSQRKSLSSTKGKEAKSKVSEETEEEASLRLAIEMQAQEFSLRRRSR